MFFKAPRKLILALTAGLTVSSPARSAPDLAGVLDIGEAGMGDWSSVYLLEKGDPDSGVVAEAGRGSDVVIHSDSSTDQYYMVSFSAPDGKEQRGYVWKPFVQITGVHFAVSPPGQETASLQQPNLSREAMLELGAGPVHGKPAPRDVDHTEGNASREARFDAMQKKLELLKSSYQTLVKTPKDDSPKADEMVSKLEEQATQVVSLEKEVQELSQGLEGTDERSKLVLQRLAALQESVFNAVTAVAHLKTSHQRIARLEKAIFDQEYEPSPDPTGGAPDAMSAVHGVLEDRMKRIEAHFDELRDRVLEGERAGTHDAALRSELERAMKSFARENEALRTRLARLEVVAEVEGGSKVAAPVARLPSRPPLEELIAEVPARSTPAAPGAPAPAPTPARTASMAREPLFAGTHEAVAAAPSHRLPRDGAPRPPVDKARVEIEHLKGESNHTAAAKPKSKSRKDPSTTAAARSKDEPTEVADRQQLLKNPVVATYLNRIQELRAMQAEQREMLAATSAMASAAASGGASGGSPAEGRTRSLGEILERIQELTRVSEEEAHEAEREEQREAERLAALEAREAREAAKAKKRAPAAARASAPRRASSTPATRAPAQGTEDFTPAQVQRLMSLRLD